MRFDLISIDPGDAEAAGHVCYAAQFVVGELCDLDTITYEDAAEWCYENGRAEIVVIEKPQMDQRSRKVPPRVLIGLAWNGALVAGALQPIKLIPLTPSEWKGEVNKAPHHLRIWRTLKEHERRIVAESVSLTRKRSKPLTTDDVETILKNAARYYVRTGKNQKHPFYDLLDAIGLGLRYLGRLKGP